MRTSFSRPVRLRYTVESRGHTPQTTKEIQMAVRNALIPAALVVLLLSPFACVNRGGGGGGGGDDDDSAADDDDSAR